MTKEAFLLLKNIHEKNGASFTLLADNGLSFKSQGKCSDIIVDESNGLIHSISINPESHYSEGKYPVQIVSTELENIQYMSSRFTIGELRVFLKTDSNYSDEQIEKFLSEFEYSRDTKKSTQD